MSLQKTWERTILIVEDDMYFRPLLMMSVSEIEPASQVFTADSASIGLTLMKTIQYDLIFCDFKLVGVENGLVLWDACKSHHPDTAFVLISGYAKSDIFRNFKVNDPRPHFLGKPFTKESLRACMGEIHGKREPAF